MTCAFDHLVIIVRDQMNWISGKIEAMGFHLTSASKHNLGSTNRLIILDNTYIEILGWEFGTTPQRKEIAELPIGLDALVFRTFDANACYQSLCDLGFSPNPVQDLSREVKIHGDVKSASFKTVRFAKQPIDGLRIYFCEHLTPEYVWIPSDMQHPNHLDHLKEITLASAQPLETYLLLNKLLQNEFSETSEVGLMAANFSIDLGNCLLKIIKESDVTTPYIKQCLIETKFSDNHLLVDERFLRLES